MLTVATAALNDYVVVGLAGVLDSSTRVQLRDEVIKAAADQPAGVIVDVDGLDVPNNDAWGVFASARWRVNCSPDVAIALVSSDPAMQERLAPLAITRYVPVFGDVPAAAASIAESRYHYRHRARAGFARHDGGVRAAQMFVRNRLAEWSMFDKIPLTATVATIFIENASSYTRGGCELRLEGTDEGIFMSVVDVAGESPAGLDVIAALCPRSGSTPTYGGRIGWARIGSDDTIVGIGELLCRADHAAS
jgi:anti-anti-sigma regulatory factor